MSPKTRSAGPGNALAVALFCFIAVAQCCRSASSLEPQRGPANEAGQVEGPPRPLFDFERFKKAFHRKYQSLGEELLRQHLFTARALEVSIGWLGFKHRVLPYYLSINHMSDWTTRELSELHMDYQLRVQLRRYEAESSDNSPPRQSKRRSALRQSLAKIFGPKNRTCAPNKPTSEPPGEEDFELAAHRGRLPADQVYTDHRKSGCFQEVRRQKGCGACYIFATLALYEFAYCSLHGHRLAFSEQFPLDCGQRVRAHWLGCQGGTEESVVDFVSKCGVELRHNYPSRGRQNRCPFAPEVPLSALGELRFVQTAPVEDADEFLGAALGRPASSARLRKVGLSEFRHYIRRTPILVAMAISRYFHWYKGGVDLARSCSPMIGTHSVLIVGYGIEAGHEYWLIRNSFSSRWGHEGYYKLSVLASCFFERYGLVSEAHLRGERPLVERNPTHELSAVLARRDHHWHRPIARLFG